MTSKQKPLDDLTPTYIQIMSLLEGCSYRQAMMIIRNVEHNLRDQSIVSGDAPPESFSTSITIFRATN